MDVEYVESASMIRDDANQTVLEDLPTKLGHFLGFLCRYTYSSSMVRIWDMIQHHHFFYHVYGWYKPYMVCDIGFTI